MNELITFCSFLAPRSPVHLLIFHCLMEANLSDIPRYTQAEEKRKGAEARGRQWRKKATLSASERLVMSLFSFDTFLTRFFLTGYDMLPSVALYNGDRTLLSPGISTKMVVWPAWRIPPPQNRKLCLPSFHITCPTCCYLLVSYGA